MQRLTSKRALRLALSLVAMAMSALALSSSAFAAGEPVCEEPLEEYVACQSISEEPGFEAEVGYEGTGELGGFSPVDLRSAYLIPETGGSEQTVAIVDAFDDPSAEADLSTYRSHYNLSACTEKNGCFKKVNQTGGTAYPLANSHWSVEISLDLDMVAAVCPSCHILLVEATSNSFANMGAAENEAAALGATEISDSWDGSERSVQTLEDKYFNHPGIPITVASGDYSYGVRFPSSSPYVISVGGTNLVKLKGSKRGWAEKVWSGTGSGCSAYESKPSWQIDAGCSHRTDTDIAAVASPSTPVSVYDSYESAGWRLVGGTSAASPIVAGIEAHATAGTRTLGAEAFYRKPSMLFDVTAGSNGSCGTEYAYLCTAEVGYDGPTGWGTPDGVPAVSEWSLVETPNPKASKETNLTGGVSCASTEACVAAGSYQNSEGTSIALAERWNGKTWTAQEPPDHQAKTGALNGNRLNSVSCVSAEVCTAVGYYTPVKGNHQATLVEKWSGKEWTSQEAPNQKKAGSLGNSMTGVSCTSSTFCIAVGDYWSPSEVKVPFTEKWNGKAWGIQEMASPGKGESEVEGISCSSSAACTAVGSYEDGSGKTVTLVEKWSGKTWTIQSSPNPATAKASWLSAVSCPTATFCTAIGAYENAEESVALAESWNGKAWTIQLLPSSKGASGSWLHGVSCNSALACTAAGGYLKEGGKGVLSLTEIWNGNEWLTQAAPSPGPWGAKAGPAEGPYGVSCTAPEACTTTGSYDGEAGHELPFSATD